MFRPTAARHRPSQLLLAAAEMRSTGSAPNFSSHCLSGTTDKACIILSAFAPTHRRRLSRLLGTWPPRRSRFHPSSSTDGGSTVNPPDLARLDKPNPDGLW